MGTHPCGRATDCVPPWAVLESPKAKRISEAGVISFLHKKQDFEIYINPQDEWHRAYFLIKANTVAAKRSRRIHGSSGTGVAAHNDVANTKGCRCKGSA